jgi:hypothetical protein
VDGKVNGWYPYAVNGAIEAEKLWVAYQSNNDMALRVFESGSFSYLVDLQNMTQQNVSLPNARKRSIRRTFNGISTQSSTIITSGKSAVQSNVPVSSIPTQSYMSSTSSAVSSSVSTLMATMLPKPPVAVMNTSTFGAPPSPAPTFKTANTTVSTVPPPQSPGANIRPVDSLCQLSKYPHVKVVEDYDVMLNQANIQTNANKFYRMQVCMYL